MNNLHFNLDVTSFDKARLCGTLDIPKKPKALLITVHGSMVQTRDGDFDASKTWFSPFGAPKRRLFIDVSRVANKLGIGVYRYDKRASGASEGVYANTDLNMLAKDVLAVYHRLRSLYPKLPIGVLGHSEGTITILRAYKYGLRPSFVILQGPALEPLKAFTTHQRTRAASTFLKDPNGLMAKKFPYISAHANAWHNGDLTYKVFNTSDRHYVLQRPGWCATVCLDKIRQYRSNWFKILKKVRCPTFIVVGGADANVPPETCHKIIRAKTRGFYPNVSVQILPGLEHSFRPCKPGENWVKVLGRPISPKYLTVLKNFLKKAV